MVSSETLLFPMSMSDGTRGVLPQHVAHVDADRVDNLFSVNMTLNFTALLITWGYFAFWDHTRDLEHRQRWSARFRAVWMLYFSSMMLVAMSVLDSSEFVSSGKLLAVYSGCVVVSLFGWLLITATYARRERS